MMLYWYVSWALMLLGSNLIGKPWYTIQTFGITWIEDVRRVYDFEGVDFDIDVNWIEIGQHFVE